MIIFIITTAIIVMMSLVYEVYLKFDGILKHLRHFVKHKNKIAGDKTKQK
jgi:hypothetical protein